MKMTMKSAGHRGHQSTVLRTALLLFVSISAVSSASTCQEGREFLTEDQICCDRCPAGYKLVENCHGPNHRTNCTRCPRGQYMDNMNYFPNCFSCRRCRDYNYEIEVSPCTRTKNTVCHCMDGYFKSMIDTRKYECVNCSKCGKNEREVKKCSPEGDTVCRCKDDYYRVNNKCLSCTNCTSSECVKECPRGSHQEKDTSDTHPFLVNVIAGAAVAVVLTLVLVAVVTHFVTKRQTEKKLLSSQEYKESPKIYEEFTTHFEEPLVHSLNAAPLQDVIVQEPSNLPDCIPLEIKIPDVIYTLLDLVPVLQVKQLVRSLGVGETVIERAELDHRSSREAHYQMLRAWAEQGGHTSRGGGGGGQGGMLHLPLLHQLLDKLRLMHLEHTAQELETKYNLL